MTEQNLWNSQEFSDAKNSRYTVQLYRVNNNYYVKNTVELKNFTYLIKNNVHFYYAIFVIFSSFPEDAIPIGRGRAWGRLSDSSSTVPIIIHSNIIRQPQAAGL